MNIPYLNLANIHAPLREQFLEKYKGILTSEQYIRGKECTYFEQQFAAYCGTKYCVGVGNGLDAIRVILQAYEIGEGDEVILPAHTFIATALAVSDTGAVPVFVDADPLTYNIDLTKIEEKITANTKAVIAVHLYGRAVETDSLRKLTEAYHLKLIEDAAQAHGAKYNGKHTGSLGDAAAFSFYPGKNLGR